MMRRREKIQWRVDCHTREGQCIRTMIWRRKKGRKKTRE
jgi:hypothetical protein